MTISIKTSLGAQLVVGGLNLNYDSLFQSLERMSSGRRINWAADNPAGLVISTQFQSQITTLNREIENMSLRIAKHETVSASVMELRSQLTELRSWAVSASNTGFNSDTAQDALAMAADYMVEAYNRVVATAEYNGAKTLDGSDGALAHITQLTGVDLSSADSVTASLEAIDNAAAELDAIIIDLGSEQSFQLEGQLQSLRIERQNLTAAESTLADTDYAAEMSVFTAILIRNQVSMALLGYSGLTAKTVLSLLAK